MIKDAIAELEDAIGKAHQALRRELGTLRTGRASPELLESIKVDYYGTPTPINQMASVTVPEARSLLIKPWDKSTIQLIEKAIQTSPVDLNPQNDGEVIRIPIPALTEERRKSLTKVARDYGEKCKIAIRSARHDARDFIEGLKKDGDVGEDEADRGLKQVESVVQDGNAKTDDIVSSKETDIREI